MVERTDGRRERVLHDYNSRMVEEEQNDNDQGFQSVHHRALHDDANHSNQVEPCRDLKS